MAREIAYDFHWDPAKALYNARKHGITFDQAGTVFLDALALTIHDEANSQREDRWFTLGYDASGRLLALAHTYEVSDHATFRCVLFLPAKPRGGNGTHMKRNRDKVKQ